jgi:methylated-DNA-[protein]-cysteine S-methyltransferase
MSQQQPGEVMVVFPSALGWMAGAWRGSVLLGLTFNHADPQAAQTSLMKTLSDGEHNILTPMPVLDEPTPQQARLVARLQAFAEGAADAFDDVPLDLHGMTAFQRGVTERCRAIPAGQVLTYGQLAAQAGSPLAARAAGQVMAKNRWPLIVPCHRVVGTGGRLGGYSAPDGLAVKQQLLQREGVLLRRSRVALATFN